MPRIFSRIFTIMMGIVLCFMLLQTCLAVVWFTSGIRYLANRELYALTARIAHILSVDETSFQRLMNADTEEFEKFLKDFFPEIQGIILYTDNGDRMLVTGDADQIETHLKKIYRIPRLSIEHYGTHAYSIEVYPRLPKHSPAQKWLKTYFTLSLILMFFILSVIFIISAKMTRRMTNEILKMADDLEQLAQGDRTIEFPRGITDEVNRLSSAADRLQLELLRNEKNQKKRVQELTHDLKGPIAGLHALIESVELGASQMSRENIDLMYRELGYLVNLIGDMAEVYKLEDSKNRFHPVSVEISALLTPLLELYQPIAARRNKSIKSKCTVETVTADPVTLGRALGNLVQNAILHGTGEPISLNIYKEDEWVVFDVINEGYIPEEDLPHIFKRYWSKAADGSGLGLSIVRMIVENHNGRLKAVNIGNNKVCFSLRLPASATARSTLLTEPVHTSDSNR